MKEKEQKKGDKAARIIGYILRYAQEQAQDGRLIDVYVHRKDIAAATGTTKGYVDTVLRTKLLHVMSTENDGRGWGIHAGTVTELQEELAHLPQPYHPGGNNAPRGGTTPWIGKSPVVRPKGTRPI